ncbi:MAG TPA: YetF domain-containing protein [Mycobacteriales bacterium]|nr:YetF domain-containing protein [Mycobacteriales bacterium]
MSIDWPTVVGFHTNPVEIVVRGTVTYLAILLLLRFTFKREAGTTSMTDLLVLVLLADAAQNAMAGDYRSVPEGLLLVATLVFWTVAVDALAYRYPRFRRIVQPKPLVLIRNGRMLRRNMRRELMTEEELLSELRQRGVADVSTVECAQMEPDGEVSIILKAGEPPVDAPGKKTF